MVNNHPEVFAHKPRAHRERSPAFHSIQRKDNQPIKSKIRRVSQKWISEVDTQVDDMARNGVIEESTLPYNNDPIHIDKDDGKMI